MLADRQTDIQTYADCNTSHPYGARNDDIINIHWKAATVYSADVQYT